MSRLKQIVTQKITIARWRISVLAVFFLTVGIISSAYLLVTNIRRILAFNDTTYPWNIGVGNSNTFTFDTNFVTVGGSGAQPISTVNKIINPSFGVGIGSWSLAAVGSSATPAGWVVVPGNSTFGTSDFLAMKYEAKCVGTSTPGVGLTAPADTTYKVYRDDGAATAANNCTSANGRAVTSLAGGYPITYLYLPEANTRCGSIAMGVGSSAHLISNNEWMTVARDAEAQNSNWSLGVGGSGYLYAGHNDNQPAIALQASTNDAYRAAFTDIGGTTEAQTTATNNNPSQSGTTGNQVRTFNLSNGSVIWDIAGNVAEWTNNLQTTAVDTTAGWVDWNHANIAVGARALYGPSSASYLSAQGMGQVYGGVIGNGFFRGGSWYYTSFAGAFTPRFVLFAVYPVRQHWLSLRQ
jgi:hypothetical protein